MASAQKELFFRFSLAILYLTIGFSTLSQSYFLSIFFIAYGLYRFWHTYNDVRSNILLFTLGKITIGNLNNLECKPAYGKTYWDITFNFKKDNVSIVEGFCRTFDDEIIYSIPLVSDNNDEIYIDFSNSNISGKNIKVLYDTSNPERNTIFSDKNERIFNLRKGCYHGIRLNPIC